MLTSVADRDILIIEDAEPLAILLGKYLKKLGYQKIHYSNNGTLGIRKFHELVESNNMPVVFLDFYLPDITALLVLKQILKIHPRTDVIIETVANQNESSIKRLFELGAHSYLPKPYELEKLKEIMNTLESEANQISQRTMDIPLMKSLLSLAIEKTLLQIGKPEYERVLNRLKEDHKCSLADCYDNPEYLKRVLNDLFGKSYDCVLESIKENLGELKSEESIQKFLAVMIS